MWEGGEGSVSMSGWYTYSQMKRGPCSRLNTRQRKREREERKRFIDSLCGGTVG